MYRYKGTNFMEKSQAKSVRDAFLWRSKSFTKTYHRKQNFLSLSIIKMSIAYYYVYLYTYIIEPSHCFLLSLLLSVVLKSKDPFFRCSHYGFITAYYGMLKFEVLFPLRYLLSSHYAKTSSKINQKILIMLHLLIISHYIVT